MKEILPEVEAWREAGGPTEAKAAKPDAAKKWPLIVGLHGAGNTLNALQVEASNPVAAMLTSKRVSVVGIRMGDGSAEEATKLSWAERAQPVWLPIWSCTARVCGVRPTRSRMSPREPWSRNSSGRPTSIQAVSWPVASRAQIAGSSPAAMPWLKAMPSVYSRQ